MSSVVIGFAFTIGHDSAIYASRELLLARAERATRPPVGGVKWEESEITRETHGDRKLV